MAKTEKAAPAKEAKTSKVQGPKSLPRLKEKYQKVIAPKLVTKYGNPMRVPKIEKIVVNMGVGQATQNAKLLEAATKEFCSGVPEFSSSLIGSETIKSPLPFHRLFRFYLLLNSKNDGPAQLKVLLFHRVLRFLQET
jgi:hypothetical protein